MTASSTSIAHCPSIVHYIFVLLLADVLSSSDITFTTEHRLTMDQIIGGARLQQTISPNPVISNRKLPKRALQSNAFHDNNMSADDVTQAKVEENSIVLKEILHIVKGLSEQVAQLTAQNMLALSATKAQKSSACDVASSSNASSPDESYNAPKPKRVKRSRSSIQTPTTRQSKQLKNEEKEKEIDLLQQQLRDKDSLPLHYLPSKCPENIPPTEIVQTHSDRMNEAVEIDVKRKVKGRRLRVRKSSTIL
mmetsp:Transcript_26294/g.56460  ORF Transcript_26294/g.56460 Transcript_26294/m.56460 type:complete len:250 (-) Transcript_26294:359-1108(-)